MGALSGKYTRKNGKKMEGFRGAFVGELAEKQYSILDALEEIAFEANASVAAVALAWVQSRPGVNSTIIGARTIEQLEANIQALEVRLTPDQIALLDARSTPTLNFPAEFNATRSPSYAHAGATVNGEATSLFPNIPTEEAERY